MNHLSGMDAMFLHIESPEMPMHIGPLNVLDLPPGSTGDFYEDAKKMMSERLHLAAVFTRKLELMPFDLADPGWVEDEDIDIDYHVRHVTLPKPGTNRQLQQYVARLHSSLLDRSRPLWEVFIIDGLKSGQVALYTKVHHAGVDGVAGANLVVGVQDVDATFARGLELGGTEALAPDDMPGVGRLAYLIDPDGNIFGFISPIMSDGTNVMG